MRQRQGRGLALSVGLATTLAVGAATGCSDGKHTATAEASASGSAGPAKTALQQAVTTMTSLRSYGFRLNATMSQGSATQELGATGRVVNPDRIQALLSSSGQSEQVIGVPEGQFQMVVAAAGKPAGKWQRAQGSSLQPIPWPKILGDLQQPTITPAPASTGSVVTGTLPPTDAVAFGYPSSATITSSQVVVALDSSFHVSRLDLKLAGRSGPDAVSVNEVVSLDGYDRQQPIAAPPGVA